MDKKMFASFKKNENSKNFCSFEVRHDGVAFAQIATNHSSSKIDLKQLGFFPYEDITHLEFTIGEISQKYNLKDINCNIILHPKDYRLLLINKPDVPATEYRSAIKWMVKDMVNYSLEDLTIDIFAPSGLTENAAKKLYVVATQTSFVKKIYDTVNRTMLNPISVDIREFAIRNLLVTIIPQNEPVIFIHFNQVSSLLLAIHKEMVYFARQISVGLDVLATNSNELATEIHNSLEYYSTEFKQTLPNKIILSPTPEKHQQLLLLTLQKISDNISFLDVNSILNSEAALTIEQQIYSYIAIGGALRK